MGFWSSTVAIAADYSGGLGVEEGDRGIPRAPLQMGPNIYLKMTHPSSFTESMSIPPLAILEPEGSLSRGTGPGYGFTLNSPILPGLGDEDYMEAFKWDLIPAFDRFKPQFMLVSAGLDAHQDDDMSETPFRPFKPRFFLDDAHVAWNRPIDMPTAGSSLSWKAATLWRDSRS